MIEENNFVEFKDLVSYARKNSTILLSLIMSKTYFFAKYLDSRRYKSEKKYTRKDGVMDE